MIEWRSFYDHLLNKESFKKGYSICLLLALSVLFETFLTFVFLLTQCVLLWNRLVGKHYHATWQFTPYYTQGIMGVVWLLPFYTSALPRSVTYLDIHQRNIYPRVSYIALEIEKIINSPKIDGIPSS